jgi:hypothetical protein
MAASTPTATPVDTSSAALVHNVSFAALIIPPIIIFLPPRKLDLYTFSLLGVMFMGGNQLSREYTGISMVQRMGNRFTTIGDGMKGMAGNKLPPKALEIQRRLKEEKEAMAAVKAARLAGEDKDSIARKVEELRVAEERGEVTKERGLLEKVWMGSEGDDWKAKRDHKEKKALEEGRGYGGLIIDQIWEVWNWEKDKMEEVKEIDEKVVKERKEKAEKEDGKK